ncbi:MAG: hypothetical protein JW955_08555 [Sedimentisphaerales bacterium]|nr:hypothetical protein [Sedimentisphaerales bacterium]
MIEPYLQDLERRIDSRVEESLFQQWRAFAGGRCEEPVFSPRRPAGVPPSVEWPHVLVNDALGDVDAMALQQLEMCSKALAEGSGALLSVRCNYGTAILPSLFGAELFLMDREIDTLPACRPLPDGSETVKRLLDRGVPDSTAGQGGAVFAMGQRHKELFKGYPNLSRHVHVYHPDLQGPMNVCEMLWGGSFYVDLYDKPDLVKDFLSLITQTYVRFMRRWQELVPPLDGFAVHWSMLHRGCIMIRNDAATNLSPAMYEQFIRPCDQQLLGEFGGGAIHFCGRGDHFIAQAADLAGVHAFNVTQPHLNDAETVFLNTVDRGIQLLGFDRQAAEQALRQGRDLHGNVHCG